MAITGIDTIEGKQIIAAGAVSAKSAEMAYNDENGNPITGYQVAGDYYSASNPSGFITGVDLTPYQTIEGMTAYQPVGNYQTAGDYLTTADSANFYTTANESGFISEVPAGTMNESAFEYNGSDRITGYNGSAFAQGGGTDLDFGYDESGAISSINTSAISDSRAGTPLYVESPLFTGQSGDSAYIGWNNETILYDNFTGRPTNTGASITLSESPLNFNYVEVYLNGSSATGTVGLANSYQKVDTRVLASSTLLTFNGILSGNSTWWDVGCAYNNVSSTTWTKVLGYTKQINSTAAGMMDNVQHLNIYKVVGVNRK